MQIVSYSSVHVACLMVQLYPFFGFTQQSFYNKFVLTLEKSQVRLDKCLVLDVLSVKLKCHVT